MKTNSINCFNLNRLDKSFKLFIYIFLLLFMFNSTFERANAETPSLKGKIYYSGEPLWEVTNIEPAFWFSNEDIGKTVSGTAVYDKGNFEVFGLPPGNYIIGTDVDLNQTNPMSYPGDLRSWDKFSISSELPAQIKIDLSKLIHLVKPADNNQQVSNRDVKCEEKTSHDGPVTFEWLPIAQDTYYDYKIQKSICKPFSYEEVIASGTIKETKVTVELESSDPNNNYIFTVGARKKGKKIGFIWNYYFRVN